MLLLPFKGSFWQGRVLGLPSECLPTESADCCIVVMVNFTSLFIKPESALGFIFGVRAQTEMKIWCVTGMCMVKSVLNETNLGVKVIIIKSLKQTGSRRPTWSLIPVDSLKVHMCMSFPVHQEAVGFTSFLWWNLLHKHSLNCGGMFQAAYHTVLPVQLLHLCIALARVKVNLQH